MALRVEVEEEEDEELAAVVQLATVDGPRAGFAKTSANVSMFDFGCSPL